MMTGFLNREGAKTGFLRGHNLAKGYCVPLVRSFLEGTRYKYHVPFVVLFLVMVLFSAFPARAGEVYDRVMERGEIRCGYFLWPSVLEKDVNTGTLSGVYYDLMTEIGARLDLKIAWTEEVSFGSMFEGFSTGRYDVICGPMSPTPGRARVSDFTRPLFWWPYYAYVAAGVTRFDNDYGAMNDPEVTFLGYDGEYSSMLPPRTFPKAQLKTLPQMADPSHLLLEIANGRADVALTDPVNAEKFMAGNPDKIRRVAGAPTYLSPITLPIPAEAARFRRMLDVTVFDILYTGTMEEIFARYPALGKHMYRASLGYEPPEER